MIIEIIGPPGIGKSYYGSKVLEFNNEIYSDKDISNKLTIVKKIIISIKIISRFITTVSFYNPILWKNNQNYFRSLLNKLISLEFAVTNNKIYLPDEGLISINLSIKTFFNKEIFVNNNLFKTDHYKIIILEHDHKKNIERLSGRPYPPTWELFKIGITMKKLLKNTKNIQKFIEQIDNRNVSFLNLDDYADNNQIIERLNSLIKN